MILSSTQINKRIDYKMRNDTVKAFRCVRRVLSQSSKAKNNFFVWIVLILLSLLCWYGMYRVFIQADEADAAEITINSNKAVLAIIGEAEGEGYKGMLAVADAIRNRGTLKGVYGLHAPRVREHLYSERTYELAFRAWIASRTLDITNSATGWGNASDLRYFKTTGWWSNCIITAHIGHQWFYRSRV